MLILSFLDPKDLLCVSLVNRHMHLLCEDGSVWKCQYRNIWPHSLHSGFCQTAFGRLEGRSVDWKLLTKERLTVEHNWKARDVRSTKSVSCLPQGSFGPLIALALSSKNEFLQGGKRSVIAVGNSHDGVWAPPPPPIHNNWPIEETCYYFPHEQ